VQHFLVSYIAGGSSQNALRGAQRLLPPGSTRYIGCVSDDDFGAELRKAAAEDGLEVAYKVDPDTPTGCCAMLITHHDRSLVTNLQAASKYTVDHLRQPDIWKLVEDARFYYIEGFFYTVSIDTIMAVAEHAAEHDKVFAMNLSAPFISQFYSDLVDKTAPYWDIIIGNEEEAAAYAKAHNLDIQGNEAIAKHMSALPKANPKRARIVVLTHGPERTCVSVGGGDAVVIPVPKVPHDAIEDTNGCGDAFVGGFLSQLVQGTSVERAVEVGHWLAAQVIRMSGAQYPKGLQLSI